MITATNLSIALVGTMLVVHSRGEVIASEYFNGYGTSEIVSSGSNLSGATGRASAWSNADEKYLPGIRLLV